MQDETLTQTLSLIDEEKPLPEGWGLVRLGDVCRVQGGFAFKSEDYLRSGNPVIRISNIQNGKVIVDAGTVFVKDSIVRNLENYKLNVGDVLMALSGATTGKIGKVPEGLENSYLNQRVGRFLPNNEKLDVSYLGLLLSQSSHLENIFANAFGSAIPNVSPSFLESLQIPLPPTIEEQRRIASVLDKQMKAVEQARLAVEAQLKAANLLPNAFLRVTFESEEAQNWQKRKLGELLNLRKDIVHPRNNPKGEALFVGLEHIESSTGKRIGAIEVKKEQLTGRKPQFFKDDLVYGYLRPYLNKLWKAEFDGLCSVDQYVYSVDTDKADIDYLAYFMRSPVYLTKAPIDTTPGQLPRIRTDEVASVEIKLPNIENQKKTARKLTEQLREADDLKTALMEKRKAIKNLPAALLRKAFAGEI